MVNENQNCVIQSESISGGVSKQVNNSRISSKIACDNSVRDTTLSTSSRKDKLNKKPSHKKKKKRISTINSLPSKYKRTKRGKKKKELLSQLYPTFSQVLCFSEHHMNYLELQQISLDGYSLGTGYSRSLYVNEGSVYLFKRG
jgi:hypothetical protein